MNTYQERHNPACASEACRRGPKTRTDFHMEGGRALDGSYRGGTFKEPSPERRSNETALSGAAVMQISGPQTGFVCF